MAKQRKTLVTDLIIGFGLAACVVVSNWDSGFSLPHLLCDGCFAAAVLLLGSGALTYCGNHGAFDMMGYGLRATVGLVVRSLEPETDYFTYCKEKAEERKPFGHLLIAGLVYLVLAGVFMVVYSMTA